MLKGLAGLTSVAKSSNSVSVSARRSETTGLSSLLGRSRLRPRRRRRRRPSGLAAPAVRRDPHSENKSGSSSSASSAMRGSDSALEKRVDLAFRPFRRREGIFRRRTPVRRSATARGVGHSLAHPPDRAAAAVPGLGRDRAAARAFPAHGDSRYPAGARAPGVVAVRSRSRLGRAARVRDVPARGPGWVESRAVLPTLPLGNGSPLFLRGAGAAHRAAASPRSQARGKVFGFGTRLDLRNQGSFGIERWHGSRPARRRRRPSPSPAPSRIMAAGRFDFRRRRLPVAWPFVDGRRE